jgi:hypothetical protein
MQVKLVKLLPPLSRAGRKLVFGLHHLIFAGEAGEACVGKMGFALHRFTEAF